MSAAPPISRVVLLNDFSIARGGATTLVLLLLRLLRSRNVPVTMIVGDDGNNPSFAELGVDVVKLGQAALLGGNPLRTAVSGIDNRSASAVVSDWIDRNDTPGTVYHVHVWSQILSPAIFVPLRKVAERTAIHAHDFFHACPNGAFMDYRKEERCLRVPLGRDCIGTNCDRRSYAHKLWRVARQARLFSAMGRDVPWGKIVLIHEKMIEGFIRAGYRAGDLKAVRNPALPFVPERIAAERNESFFFIGRLEQEKGPQDALAAARLADVPLEIVGDGPMRAELEAQYPEMTFHGWREQKEIGALIGNARALVIPSRLPEPFGLVAAEAAASGIPLILTDMAFLADDVVKRGMGIACNTQDNAAFAAALRELAAMPPETMRRMSERAFASGMKLANTQADWVDALLEIYGELAGRPPAADRSYGT
ncbi:glycosyltransferase family 4 protein [Shinella sp. BYT-45]|uniref:glycosyltransferase family 4 protein n=1 Tax=Shinella sp. BYT-45 TaxID=3377377 RepID=UPI003980F93E